MQAGQPGRLERGQPHADAEVAVMQRAGTRAGEHEPFLTGLGEAAQMPPDDRDDHRGDRHDPRACPGLGQPEGKPAAADLRQLPDDSHGAHVQVDIAALQRPQRRLLNMAGRTSAWYRFPTASAALPVGLRRPNRLTWRPCLLRHPPGHPPRRAPGLGQPPGRHPARMPHPPRHLQRNHRLGPPHRHQPHPGRVTPSRRGTFRLGDHSLDPGVYEEDGEE